MKIQDSFTLKELKEPNQVNFLTWGKIDVSSEGIVRIDVNGEKVELLYDKNTFTPSVETVALDDPRLSNVWGKEIYRLSLNAGKMVKSGTYTFTIKQNINKRRMKNWIALAFSAFLISCGGTPKTVEKSFIDENIDFARAQLGNEIEVIEASGKCLNPVTLKKDSSVYYCGYGDWRSGFFPGSVWYLYELTGDTALLPLAQKYTWAIEEAKNLTWHHDIGFIVNCSFGNGLRLTADPSYKDVMVQAAKSLSTRFREAPQVIQSWNVDKGWQSERGWECPVIIDNMMNLELMFEATRLSGDSSFYNIAIAHADRTLQEHFRPDGSCYHVIDL